MKMTLREKIAKLDKLNDKYSKARAAFVRTTGRGAQGTKAAARMDKADVKATTFAKAQLNWPSRQPLISGVFLYDFVAAVFAEEEDRPF